MAKKKAKVGHDKVDPAESRSAEIILLRFGMEYSLWLMARGVALGISPSLVSSYARSAVRKAARLHDLGYKPRPLAALPEGMRADIWRTLRRER